MFLKFLDKIIFKSCCILCNDPAQQGKDLCLPCEKELPWIIDACRICALPLSGSEKICGKCLKEKPPFEKSITLCRYEFPMSYLITTLKFNYQLTVARLLGELLSEKISASYQQDVLPEKIIPIPLHSKRLRERGFNQALEIARPVAKNLKLRIDHKNTRRVRETAAQMSLVAKQRHGNVKAAFSVDAALGAEHVAVIDDVMTTGHTMSEFCKQLKAGGVRRIDVWCCARTSLERRRLG
jgi:ComF family protein